MPTGFLLYGIRLLFQILRVKLLPEAVGSSSFDVFFLKSVGLVGQIATGTNFS